MHTALRSTAAIAVCAFSLSACVPMALFASSSDASYANKRSDWGTFVTSNEVNTLCLVPKLRFLVWEFEGHFGRKVIMSSGYRDSNHNAQTGGAENSYHKRCMATDFYIPGVDKRDLIMFAMRTEAVGGLGCYPGRQFIHVDVRDRPRSHNRPITFSGC
ncbi:MAG: D-Ala-D-Ala carboxypeptidase family metallohydrolase [Candidatus Devosia symbiotica]|nr:D-Ala-D-Ala carboxypeptidase family metallohydrolase [Candidatus Devosia symbiotica]